MVTIVKKSGLRNLTKTLAVVSLLAPASGYTLGIGEINLHSALNQNLDAEISLKLSGESVSDIKVSLAPPEKFDEAGVSWTSFLSKIRFETVTNSNGATVIKLTSKEALKEPFLDFLLEVSWPKGNLYREFTVLVDPPSDYNQAAIPVSKSTESYTQPPAVTPQSQHANARSSEGEYGPTLENDTLWSVAERARGQSDVSVEQMMMALYEANPQAFYKGNVHALMAGKMLKIPEKEAVLRLSRSQALAEFNRHTKSWRNHSAPAQVETAKDKPALSKAEGPALSRVGGTVDKQLTLIAPTNAAVADHAVVTSANEQVNDEKKAAAASSVTPGAAAKDESVQSVAEGTDEGSSAAVQSKIAALEKQLAMMQELIALKDQQLAALQNRPQANPVVQEQTAPSEAVAPKPADQVTPAPQQAIVQPAPQPVLPVPSEIVTVKPAAQATPAPRKTVDRPAQPVPAQPKPETGGLFDPYYVTVGGVGAAVLTLLGWLWWRKRKIEEETNTESMFASSNMIKTPEATENLSVPVVEEVTAAVHDAGTVGESSFLSEFTPSDFDSFDTDQGEIDPVSEADVYLAYGRYQQAEELIRQAIKDQPNRDECKLKLLEIFYANENKTAFEAYANELVNAGKRNEAEFWEQAAEMGREICPDSPLFSSGDDLFAVTDNEIVKNAAESVVRDDVFDIRRTNAETTSFGETGNEGFVKEITESKDNVLDFDLTSSEDDSFVDEQRNNADIDFDLSSFSMDAEESGEAAPGVMATSSAFAGQTSKAPVEDLDFDFSAFSMDSEEPDEAEHGVIASSTLGASSGMQAEEPDFDLSAFSMDSEESDEAEQGVIASSALGASSGVQVEELDFDLSAFSMDSEESDEADKDFTASGLSDLSSRTDELNKKHEFESYEFDLSSNNAETDGVEFSALESSDKDRQDVDFSLDLDDDLSGDFDFNFDLDMPTTGQDSRQHGEFGVSDLTDMDELETKLDLAKAYVDMGDADAAKDIAREVLEQGTAEQKKIARALLDELN